MVWDLVLITLDEAAYVGVTLPLEHDILREASAGLSPGCSFCLWEIEHIFYSAGAF